MAFPRSSPADSWSFSSAVVYPRKLSRWYTESGKQVALTPILICSTRVLWVEATGACFAQDGLHATERPEASEVCLVGIRTSSGRHRYLQRSATRDRTSELVLVGMTIFVSKLPLNHRTFTHRMKWRKQQDLREGFGRLTAQGHGCSKHIEH